MCVGTLLLPCTALYEKPMGCVAVIALLFFATFSFFVFFFTCSFSHQIHATMLTDILTNRMKLICIVMLSVTRAAYVYISHSLRLCIVHFLSLVIDHIFPFILFKLSHKILAAILEGSLVVVVGLA